MRIGIYCRVSSTTQIEEGNSLDTQREYGIEFCQQHNYQYKLYDEGGKSGGEIEKRIIYQQLVDDIKNKLIDGIWVFSLSRLNRDLMENLKIIKLCTDENVKLFVSGKEYDLDSGETKLQLSILSSFDEYFRSMNTFQSIQNKKRLFEKGEYVHSTIPFGYKRIDNRLEVDDLEKYIIHQILDWYIEGYSQKRIVNQLKLEYGINNQINGHNYKFNTNWVRKILLRRYYVDGIFEVSLKNEKYQFVIDKLVDESKWLLANQTYKSTLKQKRSKSLSDLEGILVCDKCGGNITLGVSYGWKRKDGTQKKYYYWSCRNNSTTHKIREWNIPLKEIEDDLFRFIERYVLREGYLRDELREIIYSDFFKKHSKTTDNQIDKKGVLKKIDQNTDKLNRLKYLYLEGDISKKEFESTKVGLNREIETLQQSLVESKIDFEIVEVLVEDWINEFVGLDTLTPIEFIKKYVKKIKIRVIEREWFNKGRMIKYGFIFNHSNIDWKRVEKEIRDSKKNNLNHLSKKTLNTLKIINDKRLYNVEVIVLWNGFNYTITNTKINVK